MQKYSLLAEKYLKQHKGRTILTLIGIIISITMFTAIGSIYYSWINNEVEIVKNSVGNYEVCFPEIGLNKVNLLKNNAEIKDGGIEKETILLKIENDILTESLREIKIKAYDKAAFDNIFRIKVTEGRLPQNSMEIIVDKRFYAVLKNKNIYTKLVGYIQGDKFEKRVEYTIVGAYDSNQITNYAISFTDIANEIEGTYEYTYYANLKDHKDIVATAKKIAEACAIPFDTNNRLLYLYGQGPDKVRNDNLAQVFLIIVGFVILCTVVVIYNSFNISVMERIKHFGILRSIGATKTQIRNLVFKEAAIMSLIAIPLGIIGGFAGIFIIFNYIMHGFLDQFKIGFYPQVIIVAALLGIFTIFLSAYFPARTASRVSPVDAIRGTTVLKGDKVKRGGGVLTKLIMGFEGYVAYKNIKRNKNRFYVTCISLTVSVVMFVFFSCFIDVLVESNKIVSSSIKVEGAFQRGYDSDSPYIDNTFISKLSNTEGIKEVYALNYDIGAVLIDKMMINDKFLPAISSPSNVTEYKDKFILPNTNIISYDKKALELLNKDNKLTIDYEDMIKNNKVIVVNKSRGRDESNNSFYDGFTKYKKGDKITTASIKGDPTAKDVIGRVEKGENVIFEVEQVIDYETMEGEQYFNSYALIMTDETYKSFTGKDKYQNVSVRYTSVDASEKLFEKLNIMADENKLNFYDVYEQKKMSDQIQKQVMVLVYGFITLIILISVVNIINTVTINLLVKRREYATFKAIGMTKGQFKKLILLEGAIYGILACIAGLPIAYILNKYGVIINNPVGEIGYKQAVWPYISGGIGIVLITLLAALFPLRKLNDMNIVDSLRIEE